MRRYILRLCGGYSKEYALSTSANFKTEFAHTWFTLTKQQPNHRNCFQFQELNFVWMCTELKETVEPFVALGKT